MKFTAALFAMTAAGVSAFAPPSVSRANTALEGILSKQTGVSAMDPAVVDRYNALEFPADKILAEYVWVDADGNTRSKTRTLPASKVRNIRSHYF